MDLPTLDLRGIEFPGQAGEFQKRQETAALVRELGDQYATYHKYLAEALEEIGERPDPKEFRSYESFAEAWTPIEAIVHAEATLRRCRAMRKEGKRLDSGLDLRTPLIDTNDHLASVE